MDWMWHFSHTHTNLWRVDTFPKERLNYFVISTPVTSGPSQRTRSSMFYQWPHMSYLSWFRFCMVLLYPLNGYPMARNDAVIHEEAIVLLMTLSLARSWFSVNLVCGFLKERLEMLIWDETFDKINVFFHQHRKHMLSWKSIVHFVAI